VALDGSFASGAGNGDQMSQPTQLKAVGTLGQQIDSRQAFGWVSIGLIPDRATNVACQIPDSLINLLMILSNVHSRSAKTMLKAGN
jgi:hypothetical protein